ncbi:cell differentiation family protein [Cavenderia fasciculata]|uniref:Cell differentiation family protein n=1 Tax=Cavenderia fasciculata TaxID=261658 RepID=F4Q402_CACFS|nr:cell differentiation family protein [Cavenderia fasciculata]EGG16916.1 cell differentiation family protein [Cavenderia fasciculata]|eukprot:XP_004355390.1 cell differentiation family protein [Cavenderia fasciculata]
MSTHNDVNDYMSNVQGMMNQGGGGGMGPTILDKESMHHIYQLVKDLTIPEKRENALVDLSKKRESVPDLAPILLNSFGTIAALLQEIVSIYPLLSPPKLKALPSNRVCNALALLQCVASHPDTRTFFLHSHIPLFLYPFLNTSSKNRPFEYLRLTSLGVIGALVKIDDSTVIDFLLSTEIMTLCVRIMETGSELSKTVATVIVQKILLDDMGLSYICAKNERILAFLLVLSNMLASLIEQPSPRLLKHVIRCYLRLCDNPKSREFLRQNLPIALQDEHPNGLITAGTYNTASPTIVINHPTSINSPALTGGLVNNIHQSLSRGAHGNIH